MIAPLALTLLLAQAPPPEECLVTKGRAAVTVEHGGRTYGLAQAACRDEFLKDPERYAQLYDALLELAAAGERIEARPASLVPS